MVEATLVESKLSTGQHILNSGAKREHAVRSVISRLALTHSCKCGYKLLKRSEKVRARHVQHDESWQWEWRKGPNRDLSQHPPPLLMKLMPKTVWGTKRSETEMRQKRKGKEGDTGRVEVMRQGWAGDHVTPLVKCSKWCFLSAVRDLDCITLLGFVISNKTCKTWNVQIRCQPSRLSSSSRWKPNSLLPMQKRPMDSSYHRCRKFSHHETSTHGRAIWTRCEDERMWRYSVYMLQSSQTLGSLGGKGYRQKTQARLSACPFLPGKRIWRWADVKMRECEDERMKRCEDERLISGRYVSTRLRSKTNRDLPEARIRCLTVAGTGSQKPPLTGGGTKSGRQDQMGVNAQGQGWKEVWKPQVGRREFLNTKALPREGVLVAQFPQLIERLPVPCWCASTISLKGKGRRPKKSHRGKGRKRQKTPLPCNMPQHIPLSIRRVGLLSIQKVFRAPTERSTHGGAIWTRFFGWKRNEMEDGSWERSENPLCI